MNVRPSRGAPLSRDASPDEILELCATTTDLVAFKTALRRFDADGWARARTELNQALLADDLVAAAPGSLAGQRDARGRLAVRFHKMQLLKAEDSARRADERAATRQASADQAGS
jgi:hypothetical protein